LTFSLSTKYCTVAVCKQVRSMILYHSKQCGIVLKSHSDGIDYIIIYFMMDDCSQKLSKQYQFKLMHALGWLMTFLCASTWKDPWFNSRSATK